jgi:hypothetical protein
MNIKNHEILLKTLYTPQLKLWKNKYDQGYILSQGEKGSVPHSAKVLM